MKLLAMLIAFGLIGYAFWDMFGPQVSSGAGASAGKATGLVGTAMDFIQSEDFTLEFDGTTQWFQVRSPKDPSIRMQAKREELVAVLRNAKSLQVPSVRIIYRSSHIPSVNQKSFESDLRSVLQPLNAVVSFQAKLD